MGQPAEKQDVIETYSKSPIEVVPEAKTSKLDEKFFNKTVRESINETGTVFALLFVIIGAIHVYRGGTQYELLRWMIAATVSHFVATYTPSLYYPIWKLWMGLGKVLEFVASNVMIGLSWTVMMVPAGVLLKLFGIRTIDLSYRANVKSYWIDKKPQDYMLFKRQF